MHRHKLNSENGRKFLLLLDAVKINQCGGIAIAYGNTLFRF